MTPGTSTAPQESAGAIVRAKGADIQAIVKRLTWPRPDLVARVPRDELPPMIATLEEALMPCGPQIAAEMARVLIGSYPSRQVHDAPIFARAIVSVLAEVPANVAREAIDKLTRESKFLPTRCEVFEACIAAAKPLTDALATARWQLGQHEAISRAIEAFPFKDVARARWERLTDPQLVSVEKYIEREAIDWAKYSASVEIQKRIGFIR